MTLHTNKKQYLDTLHKQRKNMHIRMHYNDYNDFDVLLRSVHYSAKLQIAKIHKMSKT